MGLIYTIYTVGEEIIERRGGYQRPLSTRYGAGDGLTGPLLAVRFRRRQK